MSQEKKNGNATTWLITGASSGLGYALAKYVLEQGDRVAMGARTLDAMADLAERHSGRALALTLDVTSAEQRAALCANVPEKVSPLRLVSEPSRARLA